jgi:hypothetical protein
MHYIEEAERLMAREVLPRFKSLDQIPK